MRASASRAWRAASLRPRRGPDGAPQRQTPSQKSQHDDERQRADRQPFTERDRSGAEPARAAATGWADELSITASLADSPSRHKTKTGTLGAVDVDAGGLSNYLRAMTIRPLIILPDPVLRKVSKPVERFDDELRAFADEMLATMYDAPGIGLAAIQVGEPIRMLVVDLAKEDEPQAPQVFVNPEVVARSEATNVHEEGCLSIPDYYAEVERPAAVTVKYQDLEGKEHVVEADGMTATCLQHEIDHLNGVLFIDHISRLKRDMVVKKFRKLARDNPPRRMVG